MLIPLLLSRNSNAYESDTFCFAYTQSIEVPDDTSVMNTKKKLKSHVKLHQQKYSTHELHLQCFQLYTLLRNVFVLLLEFFDRFDSEIRKKLQSRFDISLPNAIPYQIIVVACMLHRISLNCKDKNDNNI